MVSASRWAHGHHGGGAECSQRPLNPPWRRLGGASIPSTWIHCRPPRHLPLVSAAGSITHCVYTGRDSSEFLQSFSDFRLHFLKACLGAGVGLGRGACWWPHLCWPTAPARGCPAGLGCGGRAGLARCRCHITILSERLHKSSCVHVLYCEHYIPCGGPPGPGGARMQPWPVGAGTRQIRSG